MTTEERQLLLADLCARLPYGVNISLDEECNARLTGIDEDGNLTADIPADFAFNIDDIKPYLRPMGTMSAGEWEEYDPVLFLVKCGTNAERAMAHQLDFLNKRMFDYRGLIGMGLALEAPEGLYDGRISDTEFLGGKSSTVRKNT